MMIESIIQKLVNVGFKEVVVADARKINKVMSASVNEMRDARSATFFAMGESIMKSEPVALVIQGCHISNAYTGLTEAWFQKAQVRVFAMYEKVSEVNCSYLDRCVLSNTTEMLDDFLSSEGNWLLEQFDGPTVLNIVSPKAAEKTVYCDKKIKSIFEILDTTVTSDYMVFSEDFGQSQRHPFDMRIISKKHGYGVLSKYQGYVLGTSHDCLLICSANCFALDTNILNNRYLDARFKVIIIDDQNLTEEYDLSAWIKSNNVRCKIVNSLTQDVVSELLGKNTPAVIIVKGE